MEAATERQRSPRKRSRRPWTPRAPDDPTDLSRRSWWTVLKRTASEFRDDNLTDWAAALTYYSVLAIFPAIVALVSILGIVGESATQPLLDNLSGLAPGPAGDILTGALEQVSSAPAAGLGLVLGLAGALWSASGYVGAFGRAANAVYEVEEGRAFWKLRPLQIAITTVMILLLALSAIAVVLTGPLAGEVGDVVGVGDTAVQVWDIAKWPVILAFVVVLISMLYYATPNIKHPGFRWITPGGALAVVLWILASAAFAFYVANFSSYNATYGALAGVIVFLIWLWITNLAILFGVELDAELERERELVAGVPEAETLALPPREPALGKES